MSKKKNMSMADRDKAYKKVYKQTKDKRQATRAYCAGNKWASENARAVGNW